MSEPTERCGVQAAGMEVSCELPRGHNSPHKATHEWGETTWEPAYVGDLRRAVENGAWRWRALLADVLDDLGEVRSEAIDEARDELAKDPS